MSVVREMINVRGDFKQCNGLAMDDVLDIITDICVNYIFILLLIARSKGISLLKFSSHFFLWIVMDAGLNVEPIIMIIPSKDAMTADRGTPTLAVFNML